MGSNIPTSTNTIKFINKKQTPREKKVTYGNMVCDIRPQKDEKHQVRLTVGGDQIEYPGEVGTPTSDLTTVTCLVNSILFTPNAK